MTGLLRRPRIDRCRATRLAYLEALTRYLDDMDDADLRRAYADALLDHCAAVDACNEIEAAVWAAVRDRGRAEAMAVN